MNRGSNERRSCLFLLIHRIKSNWKGVNELYMIYERLNLKGWHHGKEMREVKWVENEVEWNEMKWIWWELNEVKWIGVKWEIWRNWLDEPYGKGPMVWMRWSYESDLVWLLWPNWMELMRNEVEWVNRTIRGEMSEMSDLTWWTLWESAYESIEVNPMRMTWYEWSDQFNWNRWDSMRIEWIEVEWLNGTIWVKWVKWVIWLEQPYGNGPMVWVGGTLWKWLEMSVVTNSIEIDQIRWELNELKWMERLEVKWVNWWIWLDEPYEKDPMGWVRWTLWKWLEVSDLVKPYQNEWNRWEMNELRWNKWIEVKWVNWWNWVRITLWQSPYGVSEVILSKWLGWTLWECPYQNEWNRWELNELRWIERFEVKWVKWWNWVRTTLWKWSYESIEVNPMEVTWNEWFG